MNLLRKKKAKMKINRDSRILLVEMQMVTPIKITTIINNPNKIPKTKSIKNSKLKIKYRNTSKIPSVIFSFPKSKTI